MDWKRYASRKFLLAAGALVTTVCTTFGIDAGDAIANGIVQIGGAFLGVVIVLGYLKANVNQKADDKAKTP